MYTNRRILNTPLPSICYHTHRTVQSQGMDISNFTSVFTILNLFTNFFINPMSMGNQFGTTSPFNLFNAYTPIVPNNIQNPVIPNNLEKPVQPYDMGKKFDVWSKDAAAKPLSDKKVDDFNFLDGQKGESVAGFYLNGKTGNGGIMKLSRDTIKFYDKNNDNQINYEEYVKKELGDYKDVFGDDDINSKILTKIAEDTVKNYDGKTNYADFVQKELDDYKKANPSVVLDDETLKLIKELAIKQKTAFGTMDLDGNGQIDEKEEASVFAAMDFTKSDDEIKAGKEATLDGKITQKGFVGVCAALETTPDAIKDQFQTMYTFLFTPKK